MPVLDAGKGDALHRGKHSKADESIGSFLCELCVEDEAIGGLAAFN